MGSETPPGTDYKGPCGIARESTWLTNEDIPHDRDTIVTIEKIRKRTNVKFQEGREKKVTISARFVGKERELLLNATHRATLAALTRSKECGPWWGLTIALFVEQGVRRPDGTVGPAVRIRAKRIDPKPATSGQELTAPSVDEAFEAEAKRAEGM